MARFLPFVFLISVASLFGLSWIVIRIDPDGAPIYIFGLFVALLFSSVWGILGLTAYFVRTRFYKRYSANWYFRTSFKMALYAALFIAVAAVLAILELVTLLNVTLAIAALALFAIWSYLGERSN